jgi:hypothetical protein
MAGVSDWHRKQRKKELIKNKTVRLAARDQKVKETKTLAEIDADIRKIQKQCKNEEQMPHELRSKLDRLKKERKLVQESLVEKQSLQREAVAVLKHGTNFEPFEYPQVSVYYDPMLNPLGAPPPGQPKLYYRRGGGTTMNLDDAWVVGMPERRVIPPPPPPPPPPSTKSYQPAAAAGNNNRHGGGPPRREKPSLLISKEASSVPSTSSSSAKERSNQPTKSVIDPYQLPEMPKPSASVKRTRMKRLTADIWASQQEVEYERVAGHFDSLEGVAPIVQQKRNHDYYYKDQQGHVQGPFSETMLLEWIHGGFFSSDTPVRVASSKQFKCMAQFKEFAGFFTKTTTNDETEYTNHNNTAPNNKNYTDNLQVEEDDEPEDGVLARIAALKRQQQQQQQYDDSGEDQDSVQARIAALKEQSDVKQMEDEPPIDSVQSRIAALKHQSATASDIADGEAETLPGVYDIGDEALPPPPPPTVTALDESLFAYPVSDVASYPVDDSSEAAAALYPVDDSFVDCDDDEYPATDAYPVVDEYPTSSPQEDEPPQKKVKVDAEVVAMLPSHLRKRQALVPRPTKMVDTEQQHDDYDRLMNEIDDL